MHTMALRPLILTAAAFLGLLPAWAADYVHGYAVSLAESPQLVLSAHEDTTFPLMSVVKFPLAIVVLHEVEQGRLHLDALHHLSAAQLPTDTWSPLALANPQGGEFTLMQLLQAAVSQSDNNACAHLFRLVGGAGAVQQWFRERMGADFPLCIRYGEDYFRDQSHAAANHVTPRAMAQLLHACFVEQRLLSAEQTQLLWGIMSAPSAGTPRLAAGLPEDAVLAHKSGSSGTQGGFTSAHHDIGVLRMQVGPQPRVACIASFICDSRADASTMNDAHAQLARRVVEQLVTPSPAERP